MATDPILLLWTSSAGELKQVFTCATVAVGRSASCEFAIAAPEVSRKHLLILIDKSKIFIEDLGSKNGSFVEGKRLESFQRFEFNPTSKIEFGKTEGFLKVEWAKGLIQQAPPEDTFTNSTGVKFEHLEKRVIELEGMVQNLEKHKKALQSEVEEWDSRTRSQKEQGEGQMAKLKLEEIRLTRETQERLAEGELKLAQKNKEVQKVEEVLFGLRREMHELESKIEDLHFKFEQDKMKLKVLLKDIEMDRRRDLELELVKLRLKYLQANPNEEPSPAPRPQIATPVALAPIEIPKSSDKTREKANAELKLGPDQFQLKTPSEVPPLDLGGKNPLASGSGTKGNARGPTQSPAPGGNTAIAGSAVGSGVKDSTPAKHRTSNLYFLAATMSFLAVVSALVLSYFLFFKSDQDRYRGLASPGEVKPTEDSESRPSY